MPVIYLSPYYSMMDYSIALEGVAGFRHYDRYGGSQAVYMNEATFEPGAAPIGNVYQPGNWQNVFGSEIDASIDWREGVSFELPALSAVEPSEWSAAIPGVDITGYTTTFAGLSPATIDADEVGLRVLWTARLDADTASATLSPGWVEGSTLLSADGADGAQWFASYDSDTLARATGVCSFPPTGTAQPGQPDAGIWFYGYDSSLARATLSPGWVEGSPLLSADAAVVRNLAEADGDSSQISYDYLPTVSTAVAPAKTGNLLASATTNVSDLYVGYGNTQWRANYVTTDIPDGSVIYYELRLAGGGNPTAMQVGFTCGSGKTSTAAYNNVGSGAATDGVTEFCYQEDLNTAGVVYSCLLDLPARTLKIWKNGSIRLTVTSLPIGKTWKACSALYNGWAVYQLSQASWTKADTIGFVQQPSSPGGPVSGFADNVHVLPAETENEAVYIDVFTGVAISMPVSAEPVEPVQYVVSEDDPDTSAIAFDYLPTVSTAVAPLKTGNPLEGTLLQNGSNAIYNGGWFSSASIVSVSSGILYYELVVNTSGGNLMFGFTRGNGRPANGGTWATQYNSGATAGWIGGGNTSPAEPSSYDFVYYVNAETNPNPGIRYAAVLDLNERTAKFYAGNSLRGKITNLPVGTYMAAVSVAELTATTVFNKSGFTYPGGVFNADTSPGGIVSGFADNVVTLEQPWDDADAAALTFDYLPTVSTAVAPVKIGNPVEGVLLRGNTLNLPHSNNWAAYWSPVVSGTRIYYELSLPHNYSGSVGYGFTCSSDGSPNSDGNTNAIYTYDSPTQGASIAIANDTTRTGFTVMYTRQTEAVRYSVLLDTVTRTLRFYTNGSYFCQLTNLPYRTNWRIAITTLAHNVQVYTSATQFQYGLALCDIPANADNSSPGGVVSGEATGVLTSLDETLDVGSLTYNTTSAEWLLSKIVVSESSFDTIDFGQRRLLWNSNLFGADPYLPKTDQDLITSVFNPTDAREVIEIGADTELSAAGADTVYDPKSDQGDLLTVAYTRTATNGTAFKGTYEFLAGADTSTIELWDFRHESSLYPLKEIATTGFSNAFGVAVES